MEQLNRLLDYIEARIDLDRCAEIEDRYQKALSYAQVDRPPLVISCVERALGLVAFSYAETFDDPAKMMFNQLLDRVVLGLELADDSPLAIRNDHGIIQVGSLLGGRWRLTEDNYPWMEHFESREELERITKSGYNLDLGKGGIVEKSIETLQFYAETLAQYPTCKKAIQVALPDLQGPMDTAHLLWGNDIFVAFRDEPQMLSALLTRIADVMLALVARYRPYTVDHLDPLANCQHTYMIPGRLLIRDDTSIMVSAETYTEVIRPHDARLLSEAGKGSIHFCGNGQHLIDSLLEIPDLLGLDLSQPELMDFEDIYHKCSAKGIALTQISRKAEDLLSGQARKVFPTGVVFVYQAQSLDEAREVASGYHSSRR